MTFKWAYLLVAVVVVAAIAVLATTGGAVAGSSYGMGLGLVLLGGVVVLFARRSRTKPEQRPLRGGSADGIITTTPVRWLPDGPDARDLRGRGRRPCRDGKPCGLGLLRGEPVRRR